MGLSDRVAAAVNVKPGEGRTTALMLTHSFCMGLATVFFETAASALFLERFGARTLPFVYLVAAVLNTATGAVYTAVQARVRFRVLMAGTLVFLLATTIVLRVGVALSGAAWLVFGLLVWYRAISALTDLEYWAVAAHLYDVRQAKRLFGFIGTGEVVARIAGSFAVPLLVKVMAVVDLLGLSAGALLACLVLVLAVLQAPAAGESSARPGAQKKKAASWVDALALLRDRYLLLIFALSFFGVLAKYFVDFAFLAEMRGRFTDSRQLASFFALFSGISQVASLLTRVFISGRLLSQHGVRVGLMVLPLLQVACTLLIVLVGGLSSSTAAVFWLVIANQGVYKTFKHPIDNPSFKVLYQPLKKDQRLRTQIAVETLVTPVTIGLSGGIMLFFSTVVPYHPVRFSLVLLATFGGWLLVARKAGAGYAEALKEALKGRIDDEHAFLLFSDEASRGVLRQRLASDKPEEVIPALDLLEKTDPGSGGQQLLELLGHPSAEVRRAVLHRLARLRMAEAIPAVERAVEADQSASVRAAALRCLCVLQGREAGRYLSVFLDHRNREIRRAATLGLLDAGWKGAEDKVRTLVVSDQEAERLWAAQVLGDAAHARLHPLLKPLLHDPAPRVRRAALSAAARLKAPELWPAVAENLHEKLWVAASAAALGTGGEAALPEVATAFSRIRSASTRAQVVRVMGRIKGPRALQFLREHIEFPDQRVRYEVLEALRLCGYRPKGADEALVARMLRGEIGDLAWRLGVLRDLGQGAGTELVRQALQGEMRSARARIFLLLSFLFDAKAVLRARDNLAHESKDKRAFALEMLDVTLPAEWRALVLPLLEELPPAARLAQLEAHFPQPVQNWRMRLKELLKQPPGRVAAWTAASVMHAVAEMRMDDTSSELASYRAGGSMLKQTADWAAARLRGEGTAVGLPAGGGEGRRRPMLTIEKVIILKSVHMFGEASDDILADVAAIVEEVDVNSEDVIIRKGDPGDSMYIIVEGKVRVFDEDRTITSLGPRDIFGELALLDPEPRLASVAAEVDTRLLRLDREAFLELMEGNIEIVRGVLHVLCERLRRQSREQHAYRDAMAAATRR